MNPSVGAGGILQLRIAAGKNPGIEKVELPKDWKLVGDPAGFRDPDGVTYFTVRASADAKKGKHLGAYRT
ncbi:MAG: hypothetical protein ACI9UA_004938 [Pseudoalteromonas tetraodonis]|jgi:hypothetical protein